MDEKRETCQMMKGIHVRAEIFMYFVPLINHLSIICFLAQILTICLYYWSLTWAFENRWTRAFEVQSAKKTLDYDDNIDEK